MTTDDPSVCRPGNPQPALHHCPRTGRVISGERAVRRFRFLLLGAGLISLIWFLVRVIPKPSRAAYPCQRAAAPLASGFMVWLLSVVAAMAAWRRGKEFSRRSRHVLAWDCVCVAAVGAVVA
jgi:hypothetical protein